MKYIAELVDGEKFASQFLVASMNKGVTNNGLQYLNIEFRDSTGTIGAKKWEITPSDESLLVAGNIVYVEGETLRYKDNLQLKVMNIQPLEQDEIDITRFVKAPPIPKEELIETLRSYVHKVQDEDFQKILQYFIKEYKDKFFIYPAGVTVHHEYSSGLLVHVTTMLKLAEFIAPIYGDIDLDLLYTGIILHDLGKTIELDGVAVYHYTIEGKLLGHISLMNGELTKVLEKLGLKGEKFTLLKHLILAHHGQLEFGSPVLPLTKEAMLLSLIDNLDSKMVIVGKALETTKEGEFSQRIPPLDGRTMYKPNK